ncbi:hypothetical protein GCM10009730_37590 [Streptomyces albidochromogenes]
MIQAVRMRCGTARPAHEDVRRRGTVVRGRAKPGRVNGPGCASAGESPRTRGESEGSIPIAEGRVVPERDDVYDFRGHRWSATGTVYDRGGR